MSDSTAFKDRVSRQSVTRLAHHLAAFDQRFDAPRFVERASDGLEALELKARVTHVAKALAEHLPLAFPDAAALIRGANARAATSESDTTFVFWPLATFIEREGLAHFDDAFETMHGLTGLASCEFAIRPFLEREPARAFAVLERWVDDPDVHVRRLVSEGTRPRLPWGRRLRDLQADPSPSIPLLDRLREDEAPYVRRSVSNHVNDIAKDHPDLAVQIAARWLRQGGEHVEGVVRHALRTLLKRGHADALALMGLGPPRLTLESFQITPRRLRFGGSLEMRLELLAGAAGEWMIDYAIHHRRQSGGLSAKVFKWTRRKVARGERITLVKRHAFRAISTRRYYAGPHRAEVLVNGRSVAIEDFELTDVPDP